MHANRSRMRLYQKEGDGPESQEPSPNNRRGVLPVQNDATVAVTDLAVHEAGEVGSEEQHHLRSSLAWAARPRGIPLMMR